jgi:prevent-host-death family protein
VADVSGQVDAVTTGDYHEGMKSVGVKQLKARLSEYIRLVRTGETVLITDRDEVVAELRPARRQGPGGLSIEERLQALAEAGEITRPSLPKGDWTWKVKGLGLPPGTAARLLDEVRSDRV